MAGECPLADPASRIPPGWESLELNRTPDSPTERRAATLRTHGMTTRMHAPENPNRTDGGTPPALGRTRFVSEMQVRPDDIDMFQHVHSSRYLDYVLTARFDQMARCYGMAMEEFLQRGLAWYQRSAHIEFKRPLRLGEWFTVTTWIEEMERDTVRVDFEIRRATNQKTCCDGHCHYTLVNVATGRAEPIPEEIAIRYGV